MGTSEERKEKPRTGECAKQAKTGKGWIGETQLLNLEHPEQGRKRANTTIAEMKEGRALLPPATKGGKTSTHEKRRLSRTTLLTRRKALFMDQSAEPMSPTTAGGHGRRKSYPSKKGRMNPHEVRRSLWCDSGVPRGSVKGSYMKKGLKTTKNMKTGKQDRGRNTK